MPRTSRGLSGAAFLTWACAALPLAWVLPGEPALLASPRVLLGLAAWLAFGACLIPGRRGAEDDRASARIAWVQVAAASAMVAALPFVAPNLPSSLLLFAVSAPRLPLAGRPRAGRVAIAVQTAVTALVYEAYFAELGSFAAFVGSILGLQVFAYVAGSLVRRESEAREELELALADLRSARALLESGSRLAERARLSRELHDALGHHLTALSLHLEVALRRPPEQARESIETARSVSRILLAELRDVLRDVRSVDSAELERALREVLSAVPRPHCTLTVENDLGRVPPDVGHALLRCTQEIATNAMRHAQANELRVTLRREDGRIVLRARDDGRGLGGRSTEAESTGAIRTAREPNGTPPAGSGLAGMRARAEELGGRFDARDATEAPGARFELVLPLGEVER